MSVRVDLDVRSKANTTVPTVTFDIRLARKGEFLKNRCYP